MPDSSSDSATGCPAVSDDDLLGALAEIADLVTDLTPQYTDDDLDRWRRTVEASTPSWQPPRSATATSRSAAVVLAEPATAPTVAEPSDGTSLPTAEASAWWAARDSLSLQLLHDRQRPQTSAADTDPAFLALDGNGAFGIVGEALTEAVRLAGGAQVDATCTAALAHWEARVLPAQPEPVSCPWPLTQPIPAMPEPVLAEPAGLPPAVEVLVPLPRCACTPVLLEDDPLFAEFAARYPGFKAALRGFDEKRAAACICTPVEATPIVWVPVWPDLANLTP